ncbi:MAG: hypothetical protein JSR17_13515 [Proteobacteria bacterium]|nr:hypothetical protein [Pseudomonadota bacterium]
MKAGTQEYYANIQEFKKCFKSQEALLTLNGKTIPLKDCEQLGDGHSKIVYGIKGEKSCFLIPNKSRDWDALIKAEKDLCDQITAVGLRAQKYEIVPCQIQATPDSPKYTLNVMVTQRFDSIAQDESVVIYNPKDALKTLTGGPFSLYDGDIENIKNPDWNKKILSKVLKEYAVALAFKLPIHQIESTDDSVHFYFKLSPQNAPCAHFMFWDVLGDFRGVSEEPKVPTLETLKEGLRQWYDDEENSALKLLCNEIACATTYEEREQIAAQLGLGSEMFAVKQIEEALFACITDEMLQEAIAYCQAQVEAKLGKNPTYLPAFESKVKAIDISPEIKALFVSQGAQKVISLIAVNPEATRVLNSFSIQIAKELAARLHNPVILEQFKSLNAQGQIDCLIKLKSSLEALAASQQKAGKMKFA